MPSNLLSALEAAEQQDYYGYYSETLPSERDDVLDALVSAFRVGSIEEREQAQRAMSIGAYHALLRYSARMAALAVRRNSREPLQMALAAMALAGNAAIADFRDTGNAFFPASDAAYRLGRATLPDFDAAATLATGRTADQIRQAKPIFGVFGPLLARLARVMAFKGEKPTYAEDGFRYGLISEVSLTREELEQRVARARAELQAGRKTNLRLLETPNRGAKPDE